MIDTHVHFWNFDPIRDNWISDEMNAIQKDFMPKDLEPIYNELQISGCIAVQANQSENETDFLLSLSKDSPLIKGIVGWTDLRSPLLEERLQHWNTFEKIKGWRHVLQEENEAFILAEDFVKGVQQLAKYNYTYDLLVYHDQLNATIKLVEQLPNQALVLDHCGKPDLKTGNIKDWSDAIRELSYHQNVSCKVSGLLAEADWYNWTEKQMFECFDVIFSNFGTKRIMYGSDWPVMLISRPYADWFKLVRKYTSQFRETEQQDIFFNNAVEFYRLDS